MDDLDDDLADGDHDADQAERDAKALLCVQQILRDAGRLRRAKEHLRSAARSFRPSKESDHG